MKMVVFMKIKEEEILYRKGKDGWKGVKIQLNGVNRLDKDLDIMVILFPYRNF